MTSNTNNIPSLSERSPIGDLIGLSKQNKLEFCRNADGTIAWSIRGRNFFEGLPSDVFNSVINELKFYKEDTDMYSHQREKHRHLHLKKLLNYSSVSKQWQSIFKDDLSKVQIVFLENKVYLREGIPVLSELRSDRCKINGNPILFTILFWGSTFPKSNINSKLLLEACRFFPGTTKAKHLSVQREYGLRYEYTESTNVSVLQFASQLYVRGKVPIESIKIILENGADLEMELPLYTSASKAEELKNLELLFRQKLYQKAKPLLEGNQDNNSPMSMLTKDIVKKILLLPEFWETQKTEPASGYGRKGFNPFECYGI